MAVSSRIMMVFTAAMFVLQFWSHQILVEQASFDPSNPVTSVDVHKILAQKHRRIKSSSVQPPLCVGFREGPEQGSEARVWLKSFWMFKNVAEFAASHLVL